MTSQNDWSDLDSNSSANGEVDVQMDELSEFSNNSRLHLSHSHNRMKQQLGVDAKADNIMLGSVAKIKVIGVGGGGGNGGNGGAGNAGTGGGGGHGADINTCVVSKPKAGSPP